MWGLVEVCLSIQGDLATKIPARKKSVRPEALLDRAPKMITVTALAEARVLVVGSGDLVDKILRDLISYG